MDQALAPQPPTRRRVIQRLSKRNLETEEVCVGQMPAAGLGPVAIG
jgi:hypothetical protein